LSRRTLERCLHTAVRWTALVTLALFEIAGALAQTPSNEPTFLIFKYQHIVGKELDRCVRVDAKNERCHSHFQLDFTGSSISLDADIQTDPSSKPTLYAAKGENSTRSYLDLDVSIHGRQAEISENGTTRTIVLPEHYFTLQQNVPILSQQLLFAYWRAQGQPKRITLLPAGEVRIRMRGVDRFPDLSTERLTRFTVHGVTWGDETVWLTEQGEIAAVVGTDAEEDRFEAVRPQYQSELRKFAEQAAADAVADVVSAAQRITPLATGTFAFTHATVIDPNSDLAPLQDVTVVIRDGRIAAVGRKLRVPKKIRVLDASDKFILPGLWDTHAHYEQWEWGSAFLACGITSVRDVGNEIEFLVPLRRALNSGRGLGPRMYAAGLIDSDPGSLTSEHAEDAEGARTIVRRYHELGYEEIKIYQSLKPELIPVVTAEAHRLGMKVTGHIPTGVDALTGVRNGMDMINHIGFVTSVMRPKGATGVRADSPEAVQAIRLLLEHHTIVEPTLARTEFSLHPRRTPFSEIEPTVALLPPELAIILNNSGISQDREARAARALQTALDTTKILHDAGVQILAGSDQVVPGSSLHRELELLVRAGLSPLEAIRAATTVPVKVLGITDSGSIEVGKRADLVVLDANPLDDIRNIRRVHWTVLGGRVFEPVPFWNLVDIHPAKN
jgi:imidazolonepropionase-like amidohydrolase